jgi:hypothetical protein
MEAEREAAVIHEYSYYKSSEIETNPITKDQFYARLQKFSDVFEGKGQFEKEDVCGVSRYNYLGIGSETTYTWNVPVLIGENTQDFVIRWVDDKYGKPRVDFVKLEFEDGRENVFNSFQELIDFVRGL